MAKVLCIIAWAGLATAAPQYGGRKVGASVDTDAIVDTVMSSLNLDQVIAQAMRGFSGSGSTVTGTLTTRPQVTVRTSGSRFGDNSQSRFAGDSRQGGNRFTLQSSGLSAGARSVSSVDKSAVVGQVLTALNPQIEKAVAAALRALSSSSSASFGTTNQQNTFSSGSNQIRGSSVQDASSLVTQIISMLTPSITQSVKSALSGQSSSVGQPSFTSSSAGLSSASSSAGLSSDFSSGVQQTVSTQQVDQSALAQQVLSVLGPTITAQVQAAIASMQSSSSSSSLQSNNQAFQVQSVQVSEQETSRLIRQIITALTPSIRSSVQTALRAQAKTVTTVTTQASSAVDQRAVVTRIMSVLQPRIMTLVSNAISAQEAAAAQAVAAEEQRRQALLQQQRQAALIQQQRQAALIQQQRQAALLQQQRQAALLEQQKIEQQRQAARIEQQRQAALIEQRRQTAIREQQRIEQQRQAALIEQQRQAAFLEQQRQQARLAADEQRRQAALLIQQQKQSPVSSSLSGLFGSGHEVVHEIPGQVRVEYNIGSGLRI